MAKVLMSAVLDRTTEFLSDNLAKILPIAALLLIAPVALSAVLVGSINLTPNQQALGTRALILLLSLVSLTGQLALIAMAIDPMRGTADACRRAVARLPAMIAVSLLLGVVGSLTLLPIIGAIAVSGVNLAGINPTDAQAMAAAMAVIPPSIGWFVVLYMLALCGVLLWVAVRLAVLAPVIVGDGVVVRAIGRSFALTKGVFLKILGVLLLFAIVSNVAQLAARAVFGSVLQLLLGGTSPFSAANVLTALVVAVVSAGFVALASAFSAKLYLALQPAPLAHPAFHED